MGNLCGSSSKDDAPPPRPTQPTSSTSGPTPKPKQKPIVKSQAPGRTLGSGDATQSTSDPRAAAARAAEERAAKLQSAPKGALGQKLETQRKQTQIETLSAASEQNRSFRQADEAAQTRAWK